MIREEIIIDAKDGRCDAYIARPEKAGQFPAVIVYVDAMGARPATREIADRIAAQGYFVLLPDLFYRTPGKVPDAKSFFGDPAVRAEWQKSVVPTVTAANVMADTEKFLDFLDSRAEVLHGPVGMTGYCMGGRMAAQAAGHFGDRVAAAAAFHPGGLATDAPDSPHRLAVKMTARLYIAGAADDRSFDEAQQGCLRDALDDAGVPYTLEIYPAKHGWVPSDTPVHDPQQSERHYRSLFALLRSELPATR